MRFVVFIAMFLSVSVIGSPVRSSLGAERNKLYTSLPYNEVEYLQTDGQAYIDTGVVPANGSSFRADMRFGYASGSVGRRFLVADSNPAYAHYCEINQNNRLSVNGLNTLPILSENTMYDGYLVINGRESVEIGCTVNGTDYSDTTYSYMSDSFSTFMLFRLNGNFAGAGQRIGPCTISVNGIVVLEFVPVCFINEGNQSEGAMYEKISGLLYRNAGTGSFLIGPEV